MIAAGPSHGAASAAGGTKGIELVTLRAGKVTREPIELDHVAPIVAVATDKAGRIVIATRDGQLALRERGTWTHTQVRDELAPDRPGSPPAVSP